MACRHEGGNDNCEQECAVLYGEVLTGLPQRSYKDLSYTQLKRLRYEERMRLPGFAEMQQRAAAEDAEKHPDPFDGL